MGYQLRRQLRCALPPTITGLQRAVALEIADSARDETRESWVGLDDLARWTAARDTKTVRVILGRLAAAGWEFRVPIGTGKDGRPLYAVPGRRLTFRVPPFPLALEEPTTVTPAPGKEAAMPDPCPPRGETVVMAEETVVDTVATRVSPCSSSRQVSPHLSLPDLADQTLREAGVTDPRERSAILTWIDTNHRPRGRAWWRTVVHRGDLPALIADWRSHQLFQRPPTPHRPPWCGLCEEPTRLHENDQGRVVRCSRCHPLTSTAT
ncbi:hypothetical protein [Parafrankia discariae]|uniref:hypothetical protein n=1 Tax=Parafrankia discariae TaxID=365528 RepID=UPI00035E1440|nr:hypothetical protein [Parafrankia discariae]